MMLRDRLWAMLAAATTVVALIIVATAMPAALATPAATPTASTAAPNSQAATIPPTASEHVPTERPTKNVTERLAVSVSPDTTTGSFEVVVVYPARTATEAAAAKNGSLDPAWFRGQERIQTIFDTDGDTDDTLANGSLTVRHAATLAGREPTDPPHGWVTVRYETAWYGYLNGETDLHIDDTYLSAVDAGWELSVAIPSEWEPQTVAGDPVQEPAGQQLTEYQWTTTESSPSPLLVVDDPVTTQPKEDSPLGVSAGLLPALAALAVLLGWARRVHTAR